MKISITRPPIMLSVYDFTDKLTWFKVSQNMADKIGDILNSFPFIHNFFLWLSSRDQKVSVKIDTWDTWSLDVTLSQVIVPSLEKYLERIREEWQEDDFIFFDIDESDIPSGLSDSPKYVKWEYVVTCMAESFMLIEQINTDPDFESTKEVDQTISKGLLLFAKYYRNLFH